MSVIYQAGQALNLTVTKTFTEQLKAPGPLTLTILGVYDVAMSLVLDVVFKGQDGLDTRAVLKLYDYRFGSDLRRVSGEYVPHTAETEAAYRDYVHTGKVVKFLKDVAEEDLKSQGLRTLPHHHLDGSLEGRARYETALYETCAEYFQCETKAYDTLLDIQGESIPRKFAHIRVSRTDLPPDLAQGETAHFFEAPGILIERISGYRLWDLPKTPSAPREPERWREIVQAAVDAAADINTRGVIMQDCGPRNVIVNGRTHQPFLIDFAQCDFRDDPGYFTYDTDEEDGEEDEDGSDLSEEDWESLDPEARYQKVVSSTDNPGAIGTVMAKRLLRDHGVWMDIRHPRGMVKGGFSEAHMYKPS